MRILAAFALAASLTPAEAFEAIISRTARPRRRAWPRNHLASATDTDWSPLASASALRTPSAATTKVVVERGVALDVGDTFFRAESCLSRDLSVLAAYLYKVGATSRQHSPCQKEALTYS